MKTNAIHGKNLWREKILIEIKENSLLWVDDVDLKSHNLLCNVLKTFRREAREEKARA